MVVHICRQRIRHGWVLIVFLENCLVEGLKSECCRFSGLLSMLTPEATLTLQFISSLSSPHAQATISWLDKTMISLVEPAVFTSSFKNPNDAIVIVLSFSWWPFLRRSALITEGSTHFHCLDKFVASEPVGDESCLDTPQRYLYAKKLFKTKRAPSNK